MTASSPPLHHRPDGPRAGCWRNTASRPTIGLAIGPRHAKHVAGRRLVALAPARTIESGDPGDRVAPLLPWRVERRFVELKRLVDEKTVVPLVMCRLARFTDGGESALPAVLYREFDLAEWLAGDRIVAVFATIAMGAGPTCFADWPTASLRRRGAGTLPAGSRADRPARTDRPARRGLRSRGRHPGAAELGLPSRRRTAPSLHRHRCRVVRPVAGAVNLVRAAYEVLSEPELARAVRAATAGVQSLVRLAFESDRRRQRLAVEGGEHETGENRHAVADPRPHAQVLPDAARLAQAGLDRRVRRKRRRSRRSSAARIPDVPCYRDEQEMFDRHPEIEAVVLASANSRHLEQMQACARARDPHPLDEDPHASTWPSTTG